MTIGRKLVIRTTSEGPQESAAKVLALLAQSPEP